jgi:YfiH family protein
MIQPVLARVEKAGVAWWADPVLERRVGVRVGFSERVGGVSAPPYDSLNLAFHVGDEPDRVAENRRRLAASGLDVAHDPVTAEQVHGALTVPVGLEHAGAGWCAPGAGLAPVAGADGLVTIDPGLPLAMFFADCVPVVLVVESPVAGVAVAHAGWRGTAEGVHVEALEVLLTATGGDLAGVVAYLGPHIMPCHYEVGAEVLSRFADVSGTIAAARGPLDLGAYVKADLERVGVAAERTTALGRCTAEHTDTFFSHRTEAPTGRHAAFAAILRDTP